MNFCGCGNILIQVVSNQYAYFECSVCKMRHEFKSGDTLIIPPAVKPLGYHKSEHILRHLGKNNMFATVDDRPCSSCSFKYAKVAIIDGEAWYGCMGCDHVYQ
jgi:hypothetical protein